MKLKPTDRGFLRADFVDNNGDACSIQESSLATDACIWLGQNSGTHHGGKCLARMHLTQAQAKELLPLLVYFAEHGSLPRTDERTG